MRTPDLFLSSAFRIALGFALAMTSATTIIFAFVYLRITTVDESNVRRVLVDEAAKGVGYNDDELKNALDLRLTRDLRRLDYVALVDAAGKILVGNVDKMPAISIDGRAHFISDAHPPGAPGRREAAIFVARARADGSVLLLGRSLTEVYKLPLTVLQALVAAIGPMLVLALGIGVYFARRASQRLLTIHNAIAEIMRGDLHKRLPVRGGPDDLDKISRDVNLMLDEIVRLLVQIRGVGDNIAHDLRAPLSVMRVKLERGVASPDDRELRATAKQALVELDKAMVTVAALLRMSEMEHGPRSSQFKPIDLAAICADLFEFYEPIARDKSIAMALELQSSVETLGDADLMREALSNLIDNAIKFTPPGGAVRISLTKEADRPVIRVCDNGTGVEPGERDKIFERFHRTTRDNRIPGSGLGLSIAAAIANLHDFDLRVEDNRPGALFEMAGRGKSVAGAAS